MSVIINSSRLSTHVNELFPSVHKACTVNHHQCIYSSIYDVHVHTTLSFLIPTTIVDSWTKALILTTILALPVNTAYVYYGSSGHCNYKIIYLSIIGLYKSLARDLGRTLIDRTGCHNTFLLLNIESLIMYMYLNCIRSVEWLHDYPSYSHSYDNIMFQVCSSSPIIL